AASRIASSTSRVAPDTLAAPSCEGGVRPALRCPSSVRSFSPASAFCSADARTSASSFFPPAVRARLEPRRLEVVDPAPALPSLLSRPELACPAPALSFLFFIDGRCRGRRRTMFGPTEYDAAGLSSLGN